MTKPNELILTISDLSRGGAGVGRTEDGQVVFVPYTMPGDTCRIEVVGQEKRYLQGKLIELVVPAAGRLEPPCPVFGRCGGCEWQHIAYPDQWKRKVRGVSEVLTRQGINWSGSIEEMPAEDPWHYRNRVQLRGRRSAQDQIEVGMLEKGSRTLVPFDSCSIARPELNAAIQNLAPPVSEAEYFKVELEVLEGGAVRQTWDRPHAAHGFRQVNEVQNLRLRQWVTDALIGEQTKQRGLLLDLYGGCGNLSIPMAAHFERILCIDIGAKIPKEGAPKGWSAVATPVEHWIDGISARSWPQDRVAVLDPPREGMGRFGPKIAESIFKLRINTLVLVGCDEDAWARDLGFFLRQGARIDRVAALDLFPQTHHVECLARLKF